MTEMSKLNSEGEHSLGSLPSLISWASDQHISVVSGVNWISFYLVSQEQLDSMRVKFLSNLRWSISSPFSVIIPTHDYIKVKNIYRWFLRTDYPMNKSEQASILAWLRRVSETHESTGIGESAYPGLIDSLLKYPIQEDIPYCCLQVHI